MGECVNHLSAGRPHCWEAEPTLMEPATGSLVGVRTVDVMTPVLETILEEMTAADYPEKDLLAVRLALTEAIVNALVHGHRGDSSLTVVLRWSVTPQRLRVEVQDQGPGFDPAQVADPCDEANLDRPCGRGLLLMRAYMTEVCYDRRGNCVTLCKARSR